jgi:GT2 family glycosyltransferase
MRQGAADVENLARAALDNGQAALVAQDRPAAVRWLDRAHRLVPADPNVMLALATARLGEDLAAASILFQRVAQQHDVAQAWLGLAGCRFHLNDRTGAFEALAHLLSHHALTLETVDFVNRVAQGIDWCGLHGDGRLEIHASDVRIALDGRRVASGVLPAHWQGAGRIDLGPLLGSPIRVDVIRKAAGCVAAVDGGIEGWAWYPNDPAADPELTLYWPEHRRIRRIVAEDDTRHVAHTGPLACPRWFSVPARDMLPGVVHVLSAQGRHILGSPLHPGFEQAGHAGLALAMGRQYGAQVSKPELPLGGSPLLADALPPAEPIGADGRKRPVTVVVPVCDGAAVARPCLKSLFASIDDGTVVQVVDDGSRDADLRGWLDRLAQSGRIRLIRHERPEGFPAAANAGMRAAKGRDVVLLNSDTLLPKGWLERLRAAAYAAKDIGSVTPFSNNASILSYPDEASRNPRPTQADVVRLDRQAALANGAATVDIPVGVGFCLYLRRDCLNATGLFRGDVFAQGYGEENDLCLRARRLGWRHVALPGLFVGHVGSASFGGAAVHLRARNGRILERLHPGHDALIQAWQAGDPLAEVRRRIDLRRWQRPKASKSVLLVTHNEGGGVEARVAASARHYRAEGLRPIVLRPARAAGGVPAIALHDGTSGDFPNLVYAMPKEMDALLAFLRANRPHRVDLHHLSDYDRSIHDLLGRLALPYDVYVHDYASFCPRVSLVDRDHYCGEPDLGGCEACIADHGGFLAEDISIPDLRHRSAALLKGARRVIVPSNDVGARIVRHFPGVEPFTVPHEDDGAIAAPSFPVRSGPVRVCVPGAIGLHKGYDVILACARDAAARKLDLEFVVVGHTTGDARLMATGRVFITGRFDAGEAEALIRRQDADLGFIASVCPETWCLTLGDIWRAGLPACAFDLGAQGERIRRTGWGFVLPLGMPAPAINDTLIATVCAERGRMQKVSVSPRTKRHVASGRALNFAMHSDK